MNTAAGAATSKPAANLTAQQVCCEAQGSSLFSCVIVRLVYASRAMAVCMRMVFIQVLSNFSALSFQFLSVSVDVVKLREREGQRVDLGRSLKGHL